MPLPPGGFGPPHFRRRHRVAERSWADPSVDGFLRRGEPVVLKRGCPLCSKLDWSLQHLGELFGRAELPVHVTPREVRSVTRVYGDGLGVGSISPMTVANFAQQLRTRAPAGSNTPTASVKASDDRISSMVVGGLVQQLQTGQHSILRAPSCITAPVEAPSDDVAQQLKPRCSSARAPASPSEAPDEEPDRPNLYLQVLLAWARGGAVERRAEVQTELDLVDWEWLHRALAVAGEGGLEACQLWCSHGGINTPLHYDGSSNFLTQIRGRKRVLLFHPRHYFRLYPYPVGHPLDNYSMVPDPEAADLNRFPAVARAQSIEAILEAGDVLWLPAYWWHYVCQPDEGEENITLNFWAGRGRPLSHVEWLSCRGVGSVPRVAEFWGAAGTGRDEFRAALAAVGQEAVLASLSCVTEEEDRICSLVDAPEPGRDEICAALAEVGEAPPASLRSCRDMMSFLRDARKGAHCPKAEHGTEADLISSSSSARGAVRCLHSARMAEHAAALMCGSTIEGGRFLGALAAGADAGRPVGNAARQFASRLREAIADGIRGGDWDVDGMGVGAWEVDGVWRDGREVDGSGGVDEEVAALLAAVTRDGRLYPGLAPPVAGKVVSAERGDQSSPGAESV